MEFHSLSTIDLLSVMVGKARAAQLLRESRGSIATLLSQTTAPYRVDTSASQRLGAARELVRRSLSEQLKVGDALGSPLAVRDFLRLTLMGREHEAFLVLFLDAQNRLIEAEEMFRGTLTQTSVYPREVVKRSLHFNAAGVIFAHNHPSGLAEPSYADESLTRALKQALAVVDVKVLDHFVIGSNVITSFSERGIL
jgi:DNA repair protein RadC